MDPNLLLNKLHSYGIIGDANKWFSFYRNDRTQYVELFSFVISRMGMQNRHDTPLKCGVAQRTILGSVLFALYVTDLSHAVTGNEVMMILRYCSLLKHQLL